MVCSSRWSLEQYSDYEKIDGGNSNEQQYVVFSASILGLDDKFQEATEKKEFLGLILTTLEMTFSLIEEKLKLRVCASIFSREPMQPY